MARPLRLEFAGALYHVTSRGNRRESIYETDDDRHLSLDVPDERFVAEGKHQPSPWNRIRNQVYLGSEQFVDKMQKRIDDADRSVEVPLAQRRPLAKPLDYYVETTSSRNEAIAKAYAGGGYSMKALGEFFGLHYSRVNRIISEAKGKS